MLCTGRREFVKVLVDLPYDFLCTFQAGFQSREVAGTKRVSVWGLQR
jgi:hypothetical protein